MGLMHVMPYVFLLCHRYGPPYLLVRSIFSNDRHSRPRVILRLDGSTVYMNARSDFTALFNSGSRFITPSGDNLVLHNAVDFIKRRGGNSSRAVGALQTDAIRNITGTINNSAVSVVWAGS